MASKQIDESLAPGPAVSPCRALWLGVLERAMLDLQGRALSDGTKNATAADDVRRWVKTRDFDRCCLNAGTDPEKTRVVFNEMIERTANDESA